MRRFELWLDESGDFSNDQRKVERNEKPSLVGGLLIENNTFADQEISMILPEAGTYHSVDMKDQLARFRKIDERLFRNPANRLVVFSNQECIMILDNNITYLNIISQGILQILKYLNALYGDVFLRVVIANRVDTTTGEDPTVSVVRNELITRSHQYSRKDSEPFANPMITLMSMNTSHNAIPDTASPSEFAKLIFLLLTGEHSMRSPVSLLLLAITVWPMPSVREELIDEYDDNIAFIRGRASVFLLNDIKSRCIKHQFLRKFRALLGSVTHILIIFVGLNVVINCIVYHVDRAGLIHIGKICDLSGTVSKTIFDLQVILA